MEMGAKQKEVTDDHNRDYDVKKERKKEEYPSKEGWRVRLIQKCRS